MHAGGALLVKVALLAASEKPAATGDSPVADLVLTNGRVYSLRWQDPNTEGVPAPDAPFANGTWTPDAAAIAIKEGLILAHDHVNGHANQYFGHHVKQFVQHRT